MLALPTSKTWHILSTLVACLLALATVLCLVHPAALDHAHADHAEQRSTSSGHITLDLHCLLAILPAVIVLLWYCLGSLYSTTFLSLPVVPTFPPFIPPKGLIRS